MKSIKIRTRLVLFFSEWQRSTVKGFHIMTSFMFFASLYNSHLFMMSFISCLNKCDCPALSPLLWIHRYEHHIISREKAAHWIDINAWTLTTLIFFYLLSKYINIILMSIIKHFCICINWEKRLLNSSA